MCVVLKQRHKNICTYKIDTVMAHLTMSDGERDPPSCDNLTIQRHSHLLQYLSLVHYLFKRHSPTFITPIISYTLLIMLIINQKCQSFFKNIISTPNYLVNKQPKHNEINLNVLQVCCVFFSRPPDAGISKIG